MQTVEISIDLPFFLRLEDSFIVPYKKVCKDPQLPELKGQKVQITVSRRPAGAIDKSEWPKEQSTVVIRLDTHTRLSNDSINTFAIRNCLEIINKVISSYQATTLNVANAGFITPIGTSFMQLSADIRVNGQDIRDRWPSHSLNTFPLPSDKVEEFRRYLNDQDQLPLSKLFFTNAMLSLEIGQYSLAVVQSAIAVELRLTQVVRTRLIDRGWPNEAIEPYEKLTLGQKLRIPKIDPRSLKFHFSQITGFSELFKKIDNKLTRLRNDVAHRGHVASPQEAMQAVGTANEFLKIVN